MGDVLNYRLPAWVLVVAAVVAFMFGFAVGVPVGRKDAQAASLSATAHHLGGSIVPVTVRLDVTVKHPQKAVIWTYGCKGWVNGRACFGRELYWPVRLHKGRNRLRVGVLAVAYEQVPSFGAQTYRMTGDTSAVDVGLRRHSPRAQDWVGPVEVGG